MHANLAAICDAVSDRLIDLTLPLRPGTRGIDFEMSKTIDEDGWNARTLHLYSHAGTHMDAATHFFHSDEIVDGRPAKEHSIDRVPIANLFSPAWIVNVPGLAPKSEIHIAHLGEIADRFVVGESLLFRTGWSAHWEDPEIYRDGLPRIAEDLATWMVEHRVRLLGVEPPSVADVNDLEEVTRIHRILLGGGVTIVEGLTNLEAIHSPRVLFAALPLKIEGGDGCPCRAFAIEWDLESESEAAS